MKMAAMQHTKQASIYGHPYVRLLGQNRDALFLLGCLKKHECIRDEEANRQIDNQKKNLPAKLKKLNIRQKLLPKIQSPKLMIALTQSYQKTHSHMYSIADQYAPTPWLQLYLQLKKKFNFKKLNSTGTGYHFKNGSFERRLTINGQL